MVYGARCPRSALGLIDFEPDMNPPPSEAPPLATEAAQSNSFFHKAASFGVWSLLGSFAVNILLSGPARAAAQEGMRQFYYWVVLLTTLLMLASVVCGVIALCGIPRYGKRKLLWKGLVAGIVPVLLVLAAIPAYQKVREKSLERARAQQQSTSP